MIRPLSDAAERRSAVDPAGSFIVQAPAGSGKTELLTRRFLALLAVVRRPEEILAITFTRKAAAEMRTRLLETLERARGSRPQVAHAAETWELARAALDQDRRQGWSLCENPGRLAIQTIDSFNAALVRRMPWVTRLGGMPRVTENPRSLYRRAAERTLEGLGRPGAQGEGIARLLSHLDNRLDHLRDLLVGMLARRDQWMRHLAKGRGEENRRLLEHALRNLVEAELAAASGCIPFPLQEDLAELAPFAARNLLSEGKNGFLASLASMSQFPGVRAEDLPAWKGLAELMLTGEGTLRRAVNKSCGFPADKSELCLSMKRRMLDVLEWMKGQEGAVACLGKVRELPPVVYEEEQWQVLRALLDLLPLAVAELWLVFREEGEADFAEIALQARQALGDHGDPTELLLRLDNGLNHILVDEFQDTSHLQFDLLRLLTDGWMRGDGRTLFLVGDPMQSIYRFREAEVGLFLQARARGVGALPLKPLYLSANFRSQEKIVSWVNDAFARLFPEKEDTARGAVPLARAEPVHQPLVGPAVSVHPFASRDDSGEAGRVLELVRQALAETGRTVAVLVRSRSHLKQILPALRGAGVRYQAQDIDLLAERAAALDLVALTRAILHDDDRLSWLAVLRAPWCGLTLTDLHALCAGRSEPIGLLLADSGVLEGLSPDGRRRAERVAAILAQSAALRGRVPLRSLVEGCWLSLGGPVLLDEAALEDAGRVFDLLETLDYGGDLRDFEELEAGLGRLFAVPDAEADGRLQIMTIHKAKGLEFDTVILPGLGRKPAQGEQPLLRWLDTPRYGLLLGPIHPRDGVGRDPIYEAIGKVEREKEALERTRLLYVAATRARSRLHLLGHARLNAEGECRPESGSLLATLWPVVEGDFAAARAAEASVGAESAPSLLRRLKADWCPPLLTAAPLPPSSESVVASELGKTDPRRIVFSGWEAESARHAGTVVHALLERMATEGSAHWSEQRIGDLELSIRRRLSRFGVGTEEIPRALEKVQRALKNALSGKRSGWILYAHPVSACEFELSGFIDGRIVHGVVDRTFIDEDGCRWVIDYKTSEPLPGEGMEAFLRAESERYRPQLTTYAELFRRLDPHRPVRAGLYFPLFDGWYEVSVHTPEFN